MPKSTEVGARVAISREVIKTKAIELLTAGENTKFMLTGKMVRFFMKKTGLDWKQTEKLLIEYGMNEVLLEQQDYGYLSDERYCDAYINSKQNYGVRYLIEKLRQKGVDTELIKQKLSGLERDIESVRESRFGQGIPTDQKQRQKQIRFLLGRGFDAENVFDLFRD